MILQLLMDGLLILVMLKLFSLFKQREKDDSKDEVLKRLESLFVEAGKTADEFDEILLEKRRLAAETASLLDAKIKNLNLILNRAESALKSSGRISPERTDQAERILKMAQSGRTPEAIARKMSIPKEKVNLVLKFKKADL